VPFELSVQIGVGLGGACAINVATPIAITSTTTDQTRCHMFDSNKITR
jgi:hypothetical protein